LLHIERSGASQVLRSEPGSYWLWGIPSPDGRYLATFRTTESANVGVGRAAEEAKILPRSHSFFHHTMIVAMITVRMVEVTFTG
jgi:hypothetical protein